LIGPNVLEGQTSIYLKDLWFGFFLGQMRHTHPLFAKRPCCAGLWEMGLQFHVHVKKIQPLLTPQVSYTENRPIFGFFGFVIILSFASLSRYFSFWILGRLVSL
jgi:hypothetical protein